MTVCLVRATLAPGSRGAFAAFFGGLLHANYLLAGTVSTNPMLFILVAPAPAP